MKCLICKNGQTKPGHVTVTLEREGTTLVFKNVPALVCENCGEQYTDQATSERLLEIAEETVESGVLVDIRQYRAA
ncbi:MAG: type II toxin-antitoxin system MqsA family antitoxin [Thermodesulfobacteriota bacterium]|nr:type II toxin-antitoxin system MqsA family antitoxin [Thermodesulfobacteriota bacterium]